VVRVRCYSYGEFNVITCHFLGNMRLGSIQEMIVIAGLKSGVVVDYVNDLAAHHVL